MGKNSGVINSGSVVFDQITSDITLFIERNLGKSKTVTTAASGSTTQDSTHIQMN